MDNRIPHTGDIWHNRKYKLHLLILEEEYEPGCARPIEYKVLILDTGKMSRGTISEFFLQCDFVS